jgi:hypothetical protein
MLTGFFCLGLNDIQIKMLVGAINFNRATSFAGLLIRKDLVSLVDLLSR